MDELKEQLAAAQAEIMKLRNQLADDSAKFFDMVGQCKRKQDEIDRLHRQLVTADQAIARLRKQLGRKWS